MKNYLYIVVCILIVSCQKVINVDLNKKDPQFVVEGNIIKGDSIHTLKLTKTLNFDQDQAYPIVENAVITISDDLGNKGSFVYSGKGIYTLKNYLGIEGRTYSLSISVNEETFTTSTTMPYSVKLEGLIPQAVAFGQDTFRVVVPLRFDPLGIKNYYRFDIYKNDTLLKGINIQNDQFSDGEYSFEPVGNGDFKKNDKVKVSMYCIDKPIWSYLNQLNANVSGGASPANPTSLFSNGALGYFSACTKESAEMVFPE